ncbi:MAG: amidohydrolase [Hyphomonas sp.]|uniref:amidohydrolase n=1 Tax=Hyphomonas sp. TaxID=87 RepID=UPI001823052E|nr:amidohydrolase [Hyphomonas sp.]MBA3068600.1 amidohydrolase [Hyphomonas sp.]MBU3922288.1 amidohydrolase [Alphaproteobacteria bacterium]MBU4061919.1 amidohydrolase [Alphaproteobacteria bacterium]MBU4166074.1 amidohydrolase [Alphaproteobacteria bacterium]
MRLAILLTAAIALTACAAPAPAAPAEDPRVTVFTNGTIYTGLIDDTGAPQTVSGIVVNPDGRILATIPPMSADWGDDDSEIHLVDLGGAFLYPGFTDAHAHLLGIGQRELTLNLEGTASVAELVTRVEAELDGKPEASVLVGRGWIETGWPEGRMPMASDLDPVSGAHKVILGRSDGHALVANSAALAAAGITDETADPAGGRIERGGDGKATGILIDAAMGLVQPLMTEPDDAAISHALETGAGLYASRGWTGLHNMSVSAREAPLMQALAAEGRLPLRLYNAFDPDAFAVAEGRLHETDTITNRTVKLYMDGALGSRGAQLIAPYSDRPDTSGLSLLDDEGLAAFMARAQAANVQLAIHAIGDLANRRILEAYEAGGYGASLRWRIEHAQVIHVDDLARVASGGLIASMQPSHAIGDLFFAPARLGMDRLRGAYAWATLLDLGTVIAGGSDAPVEVGSPNIEFYAAVARKDLKGFSGEGWQPEEAISRPRALALFTTGPAFASFREADLGTIEPGKLADFSVFDRDLMTVPEGDILKAEPVMTVIGGKIVWRREDGAP